MRCNNGGAGAVPAALRLAGLRADEFECCARWVAIMVVPVRFPAALRLAGLRADEFECCARWVAIMVVPERFPAALTLGRATG